MTERERLIELMAQADERCFDTQNCRECVGYGKGGKCGTHLYVDHLLSNGVIVPPVTIGQTIWHLRGWCDGSFEIAEGKVSMLQQKADKSWKVRITVNSSVWDFTPNEIGTSYFLTKEEAEKALKEKQG